jgi:hypothetical protein
MVMVYGNDVLTSYELSAQLKVECTRYSVHLPRADQ